MKSFCASNAHIPSVRMLSANDRKPIYGAFYDDLLAMIVAE